MKNQQLLRLVFSLILITGLSAGTAVTFAESDENEDDFDDKLEQFCSMTNEEKNQLLEEYPSLSQYEELLTEYCSLDEDEREDSIEKFVKEHYPNYREEDDWDVEDSLDEYCQMSEDEKAEFIESNPMVSDHQDELEEYCSLDDSHREEFIAEHEAKFEKEHEYQMKDSLEKYCSMTDDEKAAFVEEHDKTEELQAKMDEYCSLDESERKNYMSEHEYEMEYDLKTKLDNFCEMSDEEKSAHIEEYGKSEEHLAEMEEYCSLDDAGKDAFLAEHKDTMKEKVSDHKDTMKEKVAEHKDTMKEKVSEHKDTMKNMTAHKYEILRASDLTDEQKDDIKAMHMELRDFKHSLRDKSINETDKETIREQFMEKSKEFSLTWLSPRYQVAAGIDSEDVECRDGFDLVMKTSNGTPLCVKESSVEKLVKRGIAITAI